VLCLPRLIVLVSIQADRPGAWFPGLLGPYPTWFPGIGLRIRTRKTGRNFERVIMPGINTKLRNRRSLGCAQQTCSQMEGLAIVIVMRWKTTAPSDCGV